MLRVHVTQCRAGGLPAFAALLILTASGARADATTDCFADRVASFTPGTVSAPPPYNSWEPGVLLGPPGNATPTTGSLSVLSLGRGGSLTLEFTDSEIVDGPGPDFIVFENPFFCTAPPLTAADPYSVFAEPGIVAASVDGIEFRTFPYDATALSQVVSQCSDGGLLMRLTGLMGITPSFTGNYTVPDDPLVFDPAAPGGVSGHGGDAFDLATIGLTRARFVRITDPNLAISLPGSSEGLDLDAVVALHARPLLGAGQADADGDGLSDEAESFLYLTDPARADTDGDGIGDGEEAATCRDPLASGSDPFFLPVLELEVAEPSPTVLRWNFLGSGVLYDAIRGATKALRSIGGLTDLGVVTCLENDSTDLTTRGLADASLPPTGEAFFYLVRQNPAGSGLGYGSSSAHEPRLPASGDCR
ncbi:MAG TPA: hypothetical protein VFT43_04715 [Candidatus Polarisedimenticolia bacterium]|nr:hypothetical protein [Candidatus Polarisedimenticolia bacterium]